MKGYKALNQDMRATMGNGMQYELGKKYITKEELFPYENGFHFCEKIEFLNLFYPIHESRIFEVETDSKVVKCNKKCLCKNITLVRELSKQEVNDYFKVNQERLIKHRLWPIRVAVANQKYGLDTLINDKHCRVRRAVAEQGYRLDILIKDEDWFIRKSVAEQGYALDVLIKDKKTDVREAVANRGYGLDILIHDRDWPVRRAVANQGYGLDTLINDYEKLVRQAAQSKLDQMKADNNK